MLLCCSGPTWSSPTSIVLAILDLVITSTKALQACVVPAHQEQPAKPHLLPYLLRTFRRPLIATTIATTTAKNDPLLASSPPAQLDESVAPQNVALLTMLPL